MNWINCCSGSAGKKIPGKPGCWWIVFLLIGLWGCSESVAPLKIGQKAPPAVLTLLNGETKDLTVHPEKGLVITFMASWCPCSHESIPRIKDAYARYKDKDIAFLLIGMQDSKSKFEKFVKKWQVPFPAGFDKGDRIARIYGVNAPPSMIFVTREGEVKRVFYGNIKDREKDFSQWITELL